MMDDLPKLIQPGTLMVFNNSRVRRARVYGIKETTGRETEFMFLNTIDKDCLIWNTMVKNAKKQKKTPPNGAKSKVYTALSKKIFRFEWL